VIFVTVGTTKFDRLIKAVDDLAASGALDHDIICQIGNGSYIPSHCDYLRFTPSISDYITEADLVITHGGLTTLELIRVRKRFVAIANTDLADDHQSSFLEHIARLSGITWSRNPADLPKLVDTALSAPLPELNTPSLGEAILRAEYPRPPIEPRKGKP